MSIARRTLSVMRARGFVLAALIAISFASGYHLYAPSLDGASRVDRAPGILWPEGRALNEFSLTDHDGRAFGRERLSGRWTFVVFGYTSCPDVCPATLVTMHETLDAIAAPSDARGTGGTASDVGVVFVSVDPERDSSTRLREYVTFFDPRFVAVTAPHRRLRELTDQLGVAYRAAAPTESGYAVDHSSTVALVDPRGRLVALLPAPHAAARLASTLREMRGG